MQEFLAPGGEKMKSYLLALTLCFACTTLVPASAKSMAAKGPDKAHLQKIWDGWGTLNPDNVLSFMPPAHMFSSISPRSNIPAGMNTKKVCVRCGRFQECEVHGER
jgi:hypothetical protein